MAVIEHHHFNALREVLKQLRMQMTFDYLQLLDSRKNLKHCPHVGLVTPFGVIQIAYVHCDSHLLRKLHIMQIYGELVEVYGRHS